MAVDIPQPGIDDQLPLPATCCFCKGSVPFEEAAQWAVPMTRGGRRNQSFYAHVGCISDRLHTSFSVEQRSDEDSSSPKKTWCCFCAGRLRRKEAVIAFLPTESEDEAGYGFYAHVDCLAERLFPGFVWYWLGDPKQEPPVRKIESLEHEDEVAS
jgi:hypothetical protein